MEKNNYVEPNKIALVGWVDKVLDHVLIKKNITSKSQAIRIWPLNFKTMDENNEPNDICTIKPDNHALDQEQKDLKDANKYKAKKEGETVAIPFLNITTYEIMN
jgi:hypothetical protein